MHRGYRLLSDCFQICFATRTKPGSIDIANYNRTVWIISAGPDLVVLSVIAAHEFEVDLFTHCCVGMEEYEIW